MSTPRASDPPCPRAHWAFFLDVDGTLINLADTPQTACVDAALAWLYEQAVARHGTPRAEDGAAQQLIDGKQKRRQRLPRAGRGRNQRMPTRRNRWPPAALRQRGLTQLACKPRSDQR